MRQDSGESVANGRYEIGDVVGRGRRSRVHAAYDRVLHRPVAVKFLPARDDEPTPRWRAEAAALNRFDHAHLVRLLDGGEAGDEAFLVLPLMRESLTARLDRVALSREDAAALVLALADALGHVHRAGIAHGSVHPDRVLLDPYGRPCWSGLPDPSAEAGPRAVDADLHALAVLAVRCVTGDGSGRTAPTAVLDAVRAAAETGRVAGTGRRLASSLEAVAPVASGRGDRVTRVARRARLRGRPGLAAALAAGFAASVLGAIVVDGGAYRSGVGAALVTPGPTVVLADPAGSDVVSSVQGALDRLGALAAEPPPAPVATREPRVARVAADGDDRRPRASAEPTTAERPAPARDTPRASDADDRHSGGSGGSGDGPGEGRVEARDDDHDGHHHGGRNGHRDRDDDGRGHRGVVGGLLSDLL
jgi:hypothetical protein